jgi:hypothetical protein
MANTALREAPALVRCCAKWHTGRRLIPAARFSPSQARKRYGGYCTECYREWRARCRARERGEVAARTGPDLIARAERLLYPGRSYRDLTAAEWWRAVDLARDLAIVAGHYPTRPEADRAA